MNNSHYPILLVDDEHQILFSYSLILRSAGYDNVIKIKDSRKVLPLLEKQSNAVIVLDLVMPHLSGMELLWKIKTEHPHIPVIVMTALNELDKAVECMQNGASDYLVKPVEESRFVSSIQKVLELEDLQHEITSLKRHLLSGELEHEDAFSPILTKSGKMRAIFQYIESIAQSKKPVFITGETGVGKELLARAVHACSRMKGAHIAVNVAGLDDTMFSDTLFGHKKGAFTGADKNRQGLIVQAAEGTLLLDEIGDLNPSSQVKLLRLLEEKIYYPLGSDLPEKSDARIIACSNLDIEEQMKSGQFRKDLYYRLCTHHIHIPPLRERREDIPLLIDHFLNEASAALNKNKPILTRELIALISNYRFPGNIRELQALIHHAVARNKSGKLSIDTCKDFIDQKGITAAEVHMQRNDAAVSMDDIFGHFPSLKEMESHVVSEALKRSNGNQGVAASLLGISRQALNQRLKKKTELSQ